MNEIKVCVISCGMIANKAHIPAYLHRKDKYYVAAVCDINEKAAKETAERFGIKNFYSDAEEMLSKEKPDLVSVCVPNSLHKEYIMLALSYGANVIGEKPLAYKYKDAVEMYEAAAKAKKRLIACQSMRFLPERIAAKELIDEGVLGDIYYAEFSRIRRRGIPKWGKFHKKEISGGGAFLDIGVHMIDSLLWLMGNPEIESVSGTACAKIAHQKKQLKSSLYESGALKGVNMAEGYDDREFNVEDFASGSIAFKNGARANFKVAWAANIPDETSFYFAGDKSGLKLPEFKLYGSTGSFQSDLMPKITDNNPYKNEEFGGHFHLMDHVAEVLTDGVEPFIKPEETINTAAVIELFYKSSEEKREIKLEELK